VIIAYPATTANPAKISIKKEIIEKLPFDFCQAKNTPGARFELATNGLTDFRTAVAHNVSQKITIKELNV
jgi:hypothetical protein